MNWKCHTGECQFIGTEDEAYEHARTTGHTSLNTEEEVPDGSFYDTEGF